MRRCFPPILFVILPITAALTAAAAPAKRAAQAGGGLTVEGDTLTVVQKVPFDVVAPAGYKIYSWTVPATWKSNAKALTKKNRVTVTEAPDGTGEVSVLGIKALDAEPDEWSLKIHVGKPGAPPKPPDPP